MLSNSINHHKHFINSRTDKNIIKRTKIFIQQQNRLQLSSLHSIPSTNIFHMLYKCIHMHIYMKSSRFGAIFRHTRATQMFIDPCGPQHVYVPCGHIFSLFSMFFLSYFFPKAYHQQSYDRLSQSSQHHV